MIFTKKKNIDGFFLNKKENIDVLLENAINDARSDLQQRC